MNGTFKLPRIAGDARAAPARQAIIDGEICVQDERGVTDFSALPGAIKSRERDLVFFAFDLLHLDGENLRPAPLEERRAKLRLLVSQVPGRALSCPTKTTATERRSSTWSARTTWRGWFRRRRAAGTGAVRRRVEENEMLDDERHERDRRGAGQAGSALRAPGE